MHGYEAYKMHAVQERLQLAIKTVVEHYRTDGQILTWRLVHQIEREAIKILEQSGDLERKYIRMLRTSTWGYVPKVNQPVELEGLESMPPALSMIEHAYRFYH